MRENCKHILVVEDDRQIAEVLDFNLREEGYAIDIVSDGQTALRRIASTRYDLLILDLMLPGISGLEICRHVRQGESYTPIIMISGRSAESQRILGLELGADDYVTKPFSVLEVVARVRALLRRVEAMGQSASRNSGLLQHGDLRLDPLARELYLNGLAVALTVREFDLLYFFASHPGKVFSRLELLDQVWGYSHDGYEHTVNSHINRLRAKIESDPAHPERILTVWGLGYKFASGDARELE